MSWIFNIIKSMPRILSAEMVMVIMVNQYGNLVTVTFEDKNKRIFSQTYPAHAGIPRIREKFLKEDIEGGKILSECNMN